MATADIVQPLALTGGLLRRFWPQLLLIGSIGCVAHDLLLMAAVRLGHQNALGGMLVLSLVVLAKLLVVVLMFLVLHPGMPAVSAATPDGAEPASCRTVRLPDIGWTDVTATTALTACGKEDASSSDNSPPRETPDSATKPWAGVNTRRTQANAASKYSSRVPEIRGGSPGAPK